MTEASGSTGDDEENGKGSTCGTRGQHARNRFEIQPPVLMSIEAKRLERSRPRQGKGDNQQEIVGRNS
ncbi:MAG: hypothetical protein QOK48_3182 [Blastocatellia bacterium]|nr:hypothetical protein [Blastocatellia bacterium]